MLGQALGQGQATGQALGQRQALGIRVRALEWTDLETLTSLEQDLFGADAWSIETWWAELAGRPRRDYVVAVIGLVDAPRADGPGTDVHDHHHPAEVVPGAGAPGTGAPGTDAPGADAPVADALGELPAVRDEAGAIVGYGGLDVAGDIADIMTIATAPACQGRGVGRLLLDTLIDRAAGHGVVAIMLEVRADNDAARNLYERKGFDVISVRRRYYQPGDVDALIMRRLMKEGHG